MDKKQPTPPPGKIGSILVPLDGSPLAELALPWAETVARLTGGTLVLLRVVPGNGRPGLPEEDAEARSYLASVGAGLRARGLAVRKWVRHGRPAEAILGAARKVDLIVMGTHGRSGLRRWALGSVADKVLHGTEIPLLLVRGDGKRRPRPPEVRRILVPLDESPLSGSVLPFARGLGETFGASLLLCHIVETTGLVPSNPITMLAVERSVNRWMSRKVREVSRSGVEATAIVERGWVVNGILGCAQRASADLIVMATHGRSGVGRWIIGSVADGVVGRAGVPCLVVRPPAGVGQAAGGAAG